MNKIDIRKLITISEITLNLHRTLNKIKKEIDLEEKNNNLIDLINHTESLVKEIDSEIGLTHEQ